MPEVDEQLVKRVGDAIYGVQVARARNRTAEHPVDVDRLRRVFKVAHAESDRSTAIVLFFLAEDLMLEGLRLHLNSKIAGGWNSATDANGVLATASDRITLLHLLYWIRDSTAADLRILKSIRNRFAHHADVDSFDDQKIRGWVSSLEPRERRAIEALDKGKSQPSLTTRQLYLMRAVGTIQALVSDLAIGPIARLERVDPGDLQGDWDTAPENLKNVTRLAAEVMLWCIPSKS